MRVLSRERRVEPALAERALHDADRGARVFQHGPLLDVRLEIGRQLVRARLAGVADGGKPGAHKLAFSTSSTGKIPAKTPEPIITGTKRDPSSLVQEATSSGARVTMPWSFSVRITSSPAMTP